jgi:serine phosphatase RsbU (regulator of sigma subunit)
MILKKLSMFCIAIVIAQISIAQSIVSIPDKEVLQSLDYKMEVLEDKTKSLQLSQILLPTYQKQFYLPKEASANFGFAPYSYWYRVKIYVGNIKNKEKQWYLQMHNTNTDSISVYFLDTKSNIVKKYDTGDNFLYMQRPVDYHKFIFPIPQNAGDTLQVYVRTAGQYIKVHVFDLIENEQLYKDMQYSLGFLIFLLSIIFALLIYNTLLYISILESVYLYYIGYLSFILIYLMATTGIGYQMLYPNVVFIVNAIPILSAIASLSFANIFSIKFLKIKEILPIWTIKYMYFIVNTGILIEIILLCIIWDNTYLTYIFSVGMIYTIITSASIFSIGVWCFIKGSRPASFFLLAWTSLLIGVFLFILRANGYISSNFFTERSIAIGTVIEIFLLSFALADRIKITEREKRKAQRETINALKENEKIITEQNKILEERVEIRTKELATTNEELHQTNEELQVTLEALDKQKKEVQEKNQAITDSINYDRRIQEAILPTEDEFNYYLPSHFVFFQPRDIVSGDFYYLASKNNKVVIATIDCTGHGVPGAFMSMMGKEILDQIILEKEIYKPDVILNELHKGIRKALKQKESTNRDGMDLSIITVDKNTKQAFFAGAKNSATYIQNNEIFTLKADKMPIGGEQREVERIFTKQIISIETSTYFYLYSDGFQDQFGGENDKKFSITRMKELFLNIHTQDFSIQQNIVKNTFNDWIKNAKQIDDVLVIGFCV